MDGPQTRTEKKGRKKGEKGIYSAKHVRLTEALVAGASTSGSGSKGQGSGSTCEGAKAAQKKKS